MNYTTLLYEGTQYQLTATNGTVDCSTKGLSITSLFQPVQ